jgi:hypothetical protein
MQLKKEHPSLSGSSVRAKSVLSLFPHFNENVVIGLCVGAIHLGCMYCKGEYL